MKAVAVVGSGRMGKAIAALLPAGTQAQYFAHLTSENLVTFQQTLANCDGVIDFSHGENVLNAVEACVSAQKPYLIGTTGLNDAHFAALKKASTRIAVLHTPNTSLGVAILKKAVAVVAAALADNADIEIIETHHRHKQDAPSGTALALGRTITTAIGNEPKIGFSSLRGGNVAGKHVVQFFLGDETLTLGHECLNRDVFAQGAIRAAIWLFAQPPGFYTLEDMF